MDEFFCQITITWLNFFRAQFFFLRTILFSVCKIFYNSNCLHNLFVTFFFLSNHTVHKTRFVVFDELNFYIKTCFLLFFLSNNSSLGVAWIFSQIFWLNQHFALACCCYTILCATLHYSTTILVGVELRLDEERTTPHTVVAARRPMHGVEHGINSSSSQSFNQTSIVVG